MIKNVLNVLDSLIFALSVFILTSWIHSLALALLSAHSSNKYPSIPLPSKVAFVPTVISSVINAQTILKIVHPAKTKNITILPIQNWESKYVSSVSHLVKHVLAKMDVKAAYLATFFSIMNVISAMKIVRLVTVPNKIIVSHVKREY